MNLEQWLPVLVAIAGSAISGYCGIRVGMGRMEERHIALRERVDKIEEKLQDLDKTLYEWRHDEYAPQIANIWTELRPLKVIMDRIERLLQK